MDEIKRPVLTLIDCEKLKAEQDARERDRRANEPKQVGAIVIPFPVRKPHDDEDPEPPQYA